MAKLPHYGSLWMEYYDYIYYPDSAEVKKEIGGAVDAKWITNTCAIRLSYALNYNGIPVPAKFPDLVTIKGGDSKRYAIRVREMGKWLEHTLGAPDFNLTKKRGDAFDKSQIASIRGIIRFDIAFGDATGHLDMWDKTTFSSEYKTTTDYWTAATRIAVWAAA
jgi:hypothetical protein